jgi:hypothetical protein
MSTRDDEALMEKLRNLPLHERAEVEDFVDFLAARANRQAALDRLLAIAPALEAAGVEPPTEEEILGEIKVARAERRARTQRAKDSGEGRS